MPDFFGSLNPTLLQAWEVFKNWGWLPLPFILIRPLLFLYQFFIRARWDSKVEKIVMEIKLPKEVAKPIKAMEYVFAGLHGIHDVPNFRERWLEGQFQLAISFEIAGIDGEPHFYIRIPAVLKNHITSTIYAQYPEAELSQVEDYTLNVPQDIPKRGWDLWGCDFNLVKKSAYPINTYPRFEVETESKEERKVDPLSNLLEGMTTLRPGEQLWVQIVARPVIDEIPWVKEGRAVADKIARRPEKPKTRPIIQEAAEIVLFGPTPSAPVEKEIIPPEMKLTPGERDVIKAVEEKIGKWGFLTNIRFVYLAKDEVFFKPNIRIPMGFFKAVSTQNLNGLRPIKETITKIQWIMRKRRLYLRQRKLFRAYKKRWPPFFPRAGGTFILNTEELATLFHFPGRMVAPAPAISRVEAKKGGPPSGLPVEDI